MPEINDSDATAGMEVDDFEVDGLRPKVTSETATGASDAVGGPGDGTVRTVDLTAPDDRASGSTVAAAQGSTVATAQGSTVATAKGTNVDAG